MKKTAWIIALVLMLALVLCACSTTPEEEVGKPTESNSARTQTPTVTDAPDDATDDATEETLEHEVEVDDDWKIDGEFEGEGENKVYASYLVAPGGQKWQISHSYSNFIVGYDSSRCIILLAPYTQQHEFASSLWLADTSNEELILLTGDQLVIDYTVAYDTLYWYNANKEVWSCDWQSEKPSSKLYCEDALGVSPHTDEGEGAIVTPDRANWNGYGLPIYSPYGQQ